MVAHLAIPPSRTSGHGTIHTARIVRQQATLCRYRWCQSARWHRGVDLRMRKDGLTKVQDTSGVYLEC